MRHKHELKINLMQVAITGANGFIGHHLCEYLRTRGVNVTAISSTSGVSKNDNDVLLDIVQCTDDTLIASALSGCDAVVHTIGLAHSSSSNQTGQLFHKVNVESSKKVARACVASGVARLIYISSIKAQAETSRVDETCEPIPIRDADEAMPMDIYGRSKREAELELDRMLSEHKIGLYVLRPPLVYGVGQKGNLEKLYRLVESGFPLPLGAINNRRSYVSVNNLSDAVLTLLHSDQGKTGTYGISDTDISTPSLITKISESLGRRVCLTPIPVYLLKILGTLFGRQSEIEKITQSLVLDSKRFQQEFEWQPKYSLDEVLKEIALARRKNSR